LFEAMRCRFMALGLRERGLIFLVPLLLFGFLLFDGLAQAGKQRRQQQAQVAELKQQAANIQAALLQLQREETIAAADPAQAREQLQSDIAGQLAGFLSPDLMQDVLSTILADRYGVRVLALNSRPAELVGAVGSGKLYRHTLEVTLRGDYFHVVSYLKAIEQQAGLYWQKLDYQVKSWPNNTVQVELFTLSLEEAFIRA
ncbi:MAG: biosis protein MshJ, partial [Moraxellaceae bacterium]|nr:biosis protein MshJ [Moraxellaceae bacterium]